jgi:demethoxyubiquinone hydroxylase (CLK1/Coq7/Cat5 family)
MATPRDELVRGLRAAHAGEVAAALAYAGHARRAGPLLQERIRQVEREEWEHRAELARMLFALGSRPSPCAELHRTLLGFALFALGHATPVGALHLVAEHLERRGADEYHRLAELADRCAPHLADTLRAFARTEAEHASVFAELL